MRTQIASHLTKRVAAIRTAINRLNKAGKKLDPPRKPVVITNILTLSFLSEFDLLRDARQDIRARPWTNPAMRTIIEKYYRHVRAKEEIARLNVEIRRLNTWMRDDEAGMKKTLEELKTTKSPLTYELSKRLRSKQLANIKISKHLKMVESMNAFSGRKGCGVGEYTVVQEPASPSATPTLPSTAQIPPVAEDHDDDDDDDDVEDEATQVAMDQLNRLSERME